VSIAHLDRFTEPDEQVTTTERHREKQRAASVAWMHRESDR
jgi:hypothetical protein